MVKHKKRALRLSGLAALIFLVGILIFQLSQVNGEENVHISKMASTISENYMVDNDEPIACSLSGRRLQKRLNKLRKVLDSAENSEPTEKGYLFKFESTNKLNKIFNLVEAEQKCCPFFEFDIHIASYGKSFSLELSGPQGAKELMDEFLTSSD